MIKNIFKLFAYTILLNKERKAMKNGYDWSYYVGYDPQILVHKIKYEEINGKKYVSRDLSLFKNIDCPTIGTNQFDVKYDTIDDIVLPVKIRDNTTVMDIEYDIKAKKIYIKLIDEAFKRLRHYVAYYDLCANQIQVFDVTIDNLVHTSLLCDLEGHDRIHYIHNLDCDIMSSLKYKHNITLSQDIYGNIINEVWKEDKNPIILDQCSRFYRDNKLEHSIEIRYRDGRYITTYGKWEDGNFISFADGECINEYVRYFHDPDKERIEGLRNIILDQCNNKLYSDNHNGSNLAIVSRFFDDDFILFKD